jgi:hypothetical protein
LEKFLLMHLLNQVKIHSLCLTTLYYWHWMLFRNEEDRNSNKVYKKISVVNQLTKKNDVIC